MNPMITQVTIPSLVNSALPVLLYSPFLDAQTRMPWRRDRLTGSATIGWRRFQVWSVEGHVRPTDSSGKRGIDL